MAIFRGPLPSDGWTPVLNLWLRDKRMTYKAKGILSAVASHAADYELTVAQLVNESRDGRSAVYAGLNELVALGYMRMERARYEDGTLGETDFYLVAEPPGAEEAVFGPQGAPWNRKPHSGPDQRKRKKDQVKPTSRKSTSGFATSGESTPKKTKGLEDQEEKTNPPTPEPERSAPDGAGQPGGGQTDSNGSNPEDDLALVDAILTRQGVQPQTVQRANRVKLARMLSPKLAEGWTAVALTDTLGGSMEGAWTVYGSFKARVKALGDPPAPASVPSQPEGGHDGNGRCGDCNPNRMVEAIQIDAHAEDPYAWVKCPACHPELVAVEA